MTFGTFGVIFKRGAIGAAHLLVNIHTGGSMMLGIELDASNRLIYRVSQVSTSVATTTITSTTTWYCLLIGKATGAAIPRFHLYDYGASTWTHGDHGTAKANSAVGSPGFIWVGLNASALSDLNADVAVAAIWKDQAFADATIESWGIPLSLQAWLATTPSVLWAFNQASTSNPVLDITGGGADQNAIAGTSISGSDPPGFTYSLGPSIAEIMAARQLGDTPSSRRRRLVIPGYDTPYGN